MTGRGPCACFLILVLVAVAAGCQEEDGSPTGRSCSKGLESVRFALNMIEGECRDFQTVFPENLTFYGCTAWSCLDAGDELRIDWVRPNDTLHSTDRTTWDGPDGVDVVWATATRGDATGVWRALVYLNGKFRGSQLFTIRE